MIEDEQGNYFVLKKSHMSDPVQIREALVCLAAPLHKKDKKSMCPAVLYDKELD